MGAIGSTASVESGVSSDPISEVSDRSQLLAIAPQVFRDLTPNSQAVSHSSDFELGRDYHYSGAVRFRVRTHDDFRAEGAHEEAPRLGLWLIEIPDSLPAEKAQSLTWVVLSGTARGQLKTDLEGSVSDWRGGSQTNPLFEELAAKMEDEKRASADERWLRNPYYALVARNLLQGSHEQDVELVFMCLDTHECPTSGEDIIISFQDWGPASTNRHVPVSRVILGTPYFVQFVSSAPDDLSEEDRSLWQRFKDFFGLGETRTA